MRGASTVSLPFSFFFPPRSPRRVQTDMPCSLRCPRFRSLMFFSHNKSGPDFPKQTMLWGLSPPITLCQFQSGLKYDSTVCAPPPLKVYPLSSSTTTTTSPHTFPLSCPRLPLLPFPRSLLTSLPSVFSSPAALLISAGGQITLD